MKRWLILFTLILFSSTTLIAANVTEYTLKNGLKLLVKPNHRSPVAIFQIWYRVGGSYEPNGLTGISHVLEHMMFEGSKSYPGETFSKIVNENGGQLNAFTSDDYTCYWEMFAANKISLSFKMEADRMHNATLSAAAFKKELQVVLEERRMRYEDQPSMMLYERLRAAAFLSNPYHHMTIGWMGDIKNLTIQNVRDWYDAWYVPNNATIVVAGDVQPAAMFALAKKYFSAIPKQALLPQKSAVYQKPLGERQVTVELPAKLPTLIMAYNVPVLKTDKQTWQPYALDVLASILSGSDSSRFARNLVRGEQVAASANASYDPTSRLNNIFVISGVPSQTHNIAQLQAAIIAQLKQLQSTPVSGAELERIKTQVIANKIYSQDSIVSQASMLGSLVSVGLPWQLADGYVKKIQAVTAEQVQQVAQQFLQNIRLTKGVLKPLPMNGKQVQPMAAPIAATAGGIH